MSFFNHVQLFLFFTTCCSTPILAQETKQLIREYQTLLNTSCNEEKSAIMVKLATLHYKDQNHEKAFQIFLEALDETKSESYSVTETEQKIYEEALKIYLDPKAKSPHETAHLIKQKYEQVFKEHPEYHLLGYLVSTSYANNGLFIDFFETFYESYRFLPDHYLAYKTKAILHIKLFERARTGELREKERAAVKDNVALAIERNPYDTQLYKLILLFASNQEKEKLVITYLNKIVDMNIIISRHDIEFYVKEAVDVKQSHLAQRFLDKACKWYQQSRIIKAAQNFLDQHNQ